jgi:hypothetical protein
MSCSCSNGDGQNPKHTPLFTECADTATLLTMPNVYNDEARETVLEALDDTLFERPLVNLLKVAYLKGVVYRQQRDRLFWLFKGALECLPAEKKEALLDEISTLEPQLLLEVLTLNAQMDAHPPASSKKTAQ